MKIVQVLTRGDILGGAQTHVRELSLALGQLGHQVTVITGAFGIFTDQLVQAGIPCLQVKSLVRPVRPHRDFAALIQLSRVLRGLKPDLVCAHTAKAGALARAAARLHSIPSTFTPHGWSMFDRASLHARPIFRWAEWLAASLGTSVINVCEFERECARQFRICAPCKLEVVHNGVADFPLTRVREVSGQPPLLVMVARFTPQKDHSILLQALSGLLSMEWKLQLMGSGELRPRIVAQVNALGLRERVSLLPPETDVNPLLMEAQIFVLCTRFEAFPISILEAMRAGLPVVATNVGGIHESVVHEQTGLLVPPGDVLHLRAALARLIADPALRLAMGNAGLRLWSARFTASTMAANTVAVYQRALAAHAKSRQHTLLTRSSADRSSRA